MLEISKTDGVQIRFQSDALLVGVVESVLVFHVGFLDHGMRCII